jgi:dihydroorotate dehydrogenase
MNSSQKLRHKVQGSAYRHIIKPVFFLFDPENVHDFVSAVGRMLGSNPVTRAASRVVMRHHDPILEQDLLGIHFDNPIGLAAGFDKNAQLTKILPDVGFGFAEVGSITGEPCVGNKRPRLWRLKQSNSLLVYYGLKNDGAEAISKRLRGKKFRIPIGISVAKTNSANTVELEAGIADYVKAYRAFNGIGSYYTINISCPNAFGGQPFSDPVRLEALLAAIDREPHDKPVFVKFPPDLSFAQVDDLLAVLDRHNVQGIICSNLTKDRNNSNIHDKNFPVVGGMSGKVVEELTNKLIAHVYQKTRGKYLIIGCGGVFTAADAYKKIRFGASLIQMITGMIFRGPQVIGEINHGLAQLLRRDGYNNVTEAVGADNN